MTPARSRDSLSAGTRTRLRRLEAVLVVVAILVLTLWPLSSKPGFGDDRISVRFGLADGLRNLLLFLPLGIALARRGIGVFGVLLRGLLLSAGIELAQLLIPGRYTNAADLLSNGLGTLLGAALHATSAHWLWPTPRVANRLAIASALAIATVVFGTGLLLGPALPHSQYYGGRTLDLGHLARYSGRVVSADLGGQPIGDGRLSDSESVRTRWLEGEPLQLQVVLGARTNSLAPIFTIHDEFQREILLVGAERGDLLLRVRTRAQAVSLDRPALRWSGVLDDVREGTTISISARREGNGWCVTLGKWTACPLGFTAGSGWRLLWYPQLLPGDAARWLNAAWLAALALPLGLCLRATPASALAVAIGAAALRLAPLFGLLPTPPVELASGAVGLLLGALLRVAFLGRGPERALTLGTRRPLPYS